MYKIYERVVTTEEIELNKKIKNGPIELGYDNKREMSGNITGYCDEVIENDNKLIEFRLLVPEFSTSGRMKEYYIPEWRVYNTFGLTAKDVKGKYITFSTKSGDFNIIKVQD